MEALGPGDPRRMGAFRLLARLGGGGMGTVYLGRTSGGRNVAVKLIRDECAHNEEFRHRFRKEVDTARKVSGPWTPPVLDADTEGPQPWVATAYVPGPDLAQALRQFGPLPASTVRTLGAGLAEALASVHRLGLVHRDIKPSNVLLSLDGPHLIDFGIARALDGGATALTRSGHIMGSPAYMSPEQAAAKGVGPAGDVFSLGAVLATAATGRNPFGEGMDAMALLYRIRHEQPDLDGLPDTLRDVVTACLDKDPDRRPTPEQVRERLLPDPDATVRQGSWLPPALAESVARLATDLLDLDAPAAPDPPFTRPAPPPYPPTAAYPAAYSAAFPVPPRRPRRRAAALTASLVTALVTATAAWGVWSSGVLGDVVDTSSDAGGTSTPDTSPTTSEATSPPDTTATATATATATEPEPDRTADPSVVPDGFVGTWETKLTVDPTSDDATITMTLRHGRVGAVVGTMSLSSAQLICRYDLRLTVVESTRIAVTNAGVTGGSTDFCSGSPTGSDSEVLTLLSASTLQVGSGYETQRMTRQETS
ncbi:serine/threonine-protein kinase [Streptomyces bluensis]|uniref:serine/threonine-protein kinase n=1 Tax=Streptomyces bluensis TaxID=33897 RepID=UPI003326458B